MHFNTFYMHIYMFICILMYLKCISISSNCFLSIFWDFGFLISRKSRFSKTSSNQYFNLCLGQSATTKMSVSTVRPFHVFGQKSDLGHETLPKTSEMWVSHFSNYLIINSFLCKSYIMDTSSDFGQIGFYFSK